MLSNNNGPYTKKTYSVKNIFIDIIGILLPIKKIISKIYNILTYTTKKISCPLT